MIIKKWLYALVLPLLFLTGQLFAQERIVTGTVTDSAGAPIANASVVVKGAKTGTQTSAAGAFSVRVPSNASVLVISSIGYGSREVAVQNAPVNVT
ncbi:MAG: carboxypeptidase-like regulatory domain-containing protein, partial [Bacteroidota bacterium]|nr:carboxypeptidase-like regulatory domain-containing protein [Bacteroidota bacterium]